MAEKCRKAPHEGGRSPIRSSSRHFSRYHITEQSSTCLNSNLYFCASLLILCSAQEMNESSLQRISEAPHSGGSSWQPRNLSRTLLQNQSHNEFRTCSIVHTNSLYSSIILASFHHNGNEMLIPLTYCTDRAFLQHIFILYSRT